MPLLRKRPYGTIGFYNSFAIYIVIISEYTYYIGFNRHNYPRDNRDGLVQFLN